jgi:hypothetical protein
VLVVRVVGDLFGLFVQGLEGEESKAMAVWIQRHVEASLTEEYYQTEGRPSEAFWKTLYTSKII